MIWYRYYKLMNFVIWLVRSMLSVHFTCPAWFATATAGWRCSEPLFWFPPPPLPPVAVKTFRLKSFESKITSCVFPFLNPPVTRESKLHEVIDKGQNSNYRCDIICGSPCCVSIIVTCHIHTKYLILIYF